MYINYVWRRIWYNMMHVYTSHPCTHKQASHAYHDVHVITYMHAWIAYIYHATWTYGMHTINIDHIHACMNHIYASNAHTSLACHDIHHNHTHASNTHAWHAWHAHRSHGYLLHARIISHACACIASNVFVHMHQMHTHHMHTYTRSTYRHVCINMHASHITHITYTHAWTHVHHICACTYMTFMHAHVSHLYMQLHHVYACTWVLFTCCLSSVCTCVCMCICLFDLCVFPLSVCHIRMFIVYLSTYELCAFRSCQLWCVFILYYDVLFRWAVATIDRRIDDLLLFLFSPKSE